MQKSGEAYEAAFRAFAAVQLTSLLRPAYYLAGDWDEAQDLVQTALVKMYLAWPRLAPDVDRHLYARKVMLNVYRAGLRRSSRRREARAPVQPSVAGPDSQPEERDFQRRLLMTLPPQQRAVIVLRYLQDFSVRQTAECLNISEGTVKSQTSDALKSLRSVLAAERTEP